MRLREKEGSFQMQPTVSPAGTLSPFLTDLAEQVTALREKAARLETELTPAQRLWTPAPTQWTMTHCLDHLNRTADLLLPVFENAVTRLRAQGRTETEPPRFSWMERQFVRLLSPNPPFHLPVPAVYVPQIAPETTAAIFPHFLAVQERFLACFAAASGLPLQRIAVASPANRLLRMRLGAWFAAIIAHERYHWEQVEALRNHPQFPAA